jgi:acetoin utilization protein AcuB
MTPDPVTVDPDTSMMDAQRIMSEHKIRRLPVVDKKGKVVGILTLRNIIEASPSEATTLSIYELNYLLSKVTVQQIMHKDPVCVGPDDLVMDVVQQGREMGIGAFPVVENGKLVGIATETEIISAMVQVFGAKKGSSTLEILNVELEKSLGAMSKIASIIEKRGVPVEAIFTSPHRSGLGHRVYVRARTNHPGNIRTDLENAGFKTA